MRTPVCCWSTSFFFCIMMGGRLLVAPFERCSLNLIRLSVVWLLVFFLWAQKELNVSARRARTPRANSLTFSPVGCCGVLYPSLHTFLIYFNLQVVNFDEGSCYVISRYVLCVPLCFGMCMFGIANFFFRVCVVNWTASSSGRAAMIAFATEPPLWSSCTRARLISPQWPTTQ